MELNKVRTGLVGASLMGAFHALWSLLVAAGAAQALLNWVLWLHFLSNPYSVAPFGLGRAVLLVAFTSAVGFAGGWALAYAWNAVFKGKEG